SNFAPCLAGQRGLPARGDLVVYLQQPVFEVPRLLLTRALFVLQGYPRPVRQSPHSLGKVEVLVLLHEGEHIAALMASEAVKNLALRADVEAGRLLLVKRAEGDEIRTRALQRQVGPDNLHDVAGSADLFTGRGGNQA